LLDLVLNDEWGLGGEHKLDVIAKSGRLVEHVQVAQGEREADFVSFGGFSWHLAGVVRLDLDGSIADLSIDRELDVREGGLDRHGLTQLVQLTAQLREVKRVHRDLARVARLRDSEMLAVERDQVQTELSLLVLSTVLKDDLQGGRIFLGPQDNLILIASQLQHLCKVSNRHAECHGSIRPVRLESILAESQ
jgi:hypothetical protein